jgi:hypothetical protein
MGVQKCDDGGHIGATDGHNQKQKAGMLLKNSDLRFALEPLCAQLPDCRKLPATQIKRFVKARGNKS